MCSSVCVFRIGQVQFLIFLRSNYIFLPMVQQPLVGPGPPRYRGFTQSHTTLITSPLDE